MKKRRGTRNIAIIAILVAVIGLSIGFATLNATLKITSNTTVKGAKWAIEFQNLSSAQIMGDVKETVPAQIDESKTGITMSLEFGAAPITDANIGYTFEVHNAGTVDAKLLGDPAIDLGDLDGKLEVTIKDITSGTPGENVTEGTPIGAGETKKYALSIKYPEAQNDTLVEEDKTADITIEFNFVQDTVGSAG